MQMLRLQEAVRLLDKVLAALVDDDADRAAVENAMVSYCVVILCSECEKALKAAVKEKCSAIVEQDLRTFSQAVSEKVTGKMSISDLCGTLGMFSPDKKKIFSDSVVNSSDGLDLAWDRMFKARTRVAHHAEPSEYTAKSLHKDIPLCHKVINHYRRALGLVEL